MPAPVKPSTLSMPMPADACSLKNHHTGDACSRHPRRLSVPSVDRFVQAPQGGYQCLAPTGSCRHLYVPIIAFVSGSRCPEVPVGAERRTCLSARGLAWPGLPSLSSLFRAALRRGGCREVCIPQWHSRREDTLFGTARGQICGPKDGPLGGPVS